MNRTLQAHMSFLGWGDPHAPTWIVGSEEGGMYEDYSEAEARAESIFGMMSYTVGNRTFRMTTFSKEPTGHDARTYDRLRTLLSKIDANAQLGDKNNFLLEFVASSRWMEEKGALD